MTDTLYVHYKDRLCGYLIKDKKEISFVYDRKYLSEPDSVSISLSIPLGTERFDKENILPFFEGILPEECIRKRICCLLNIDENDTFSLLMELCSDSAGAISVHKEEVQFNQSEKSYKLLSKQDAFYVLRNLDARPFAIGNGARITLAGAQDKLICALIDNSIALPLKNTPSTHIIKPNIDGLKDTVCNEIFCMKLAKECGLKVPECFIYSLKDQRYYVVKRYDRELVSNSYVGVHQEDFCQLLKVLPVNKYESDGGPSLKDCFALIQDLKIDASGKRDFLDLVIFNYLIGNGDAHAKNFSVLRKDNLLSLAPCYDLMCTAVYANYYPKHKMAMKLCSSNYLMCRVTRKNFEALDEISLFKKSYILKRVDLMRKTILQKASDLAKALNNEEKTKSDIYEKIIRIIEKHVNALEE